MSDNRSLTETILGYLGPEMDSVVGIYIHCTSKLPPSEAKNKELENPSGLKAFTDAMNKAGYYVKILEFPHYKEVQIKPNKYKGTPDE